MFLKFFKYEMSDYKANYIFILVFQLIMSILIRNEIAYFDEFTRSTGPLSPIIYIPFFLLFMIIIKSFSTKLFSPSAYLLFSVPAKISSIINSKILANIFKVFLLYLIFSYGHISDVINPGSRNESYIFASDNLIQYPLNIFIYFLIITFFVYILMLLSTISHTLYRGKHKVLFSILILILIIGFVYGGIFLLHILDFLNEDTLNGIILNVNFWLIPIFFISSYLILKIPSHLIKNKLEL